MSILNIRLITIGCVGASIFEETKLKSICRELGKFKYSDISLESLNSIKYYFVKNDYNFRKEILSTHILLNPLINLYDVKYLHESQQSGGWLDLANYTINKQTNLNLIPGIQ